MEQQGRGGARLASSPPGPCTAHSWAGGPAVQGFVRVAVQTGASLVPVLSFGENNIFTTYRPDKRSRLAKVQRCVPGAWRASAARAGCGSLSMRARRAAAEPGLSAWSQNVPGPALVSAPPSEQPRGCTAGRLASLRMQHTAGVGKCMPIHARAARARPPPCPQAAVTPAVCRRSWLLRVVGLGFPIIRGTGLFNTRIGLLPKQARPRRGPCGSCPVRARGLVSQWRVKGSA